MAGGQFGRWFISYETWLWDLGTHLFSLLVPGGLSCFKFSTAELALEINRGDAQLERLLETSEVSEFELNWHLPWQKTTFYHWQILSVSTASTKANYRIQNVFEWWHAHDIYFKTFLKSHNMRIFVCTWVYMALCIWNITNTCILFFKGNLLFWGLFWQRFSSGNRGELSHILL